MEADGGCEKRALASPSAMMAATSQQDGGTSASDQSKEPGLLASSLQTAGQSHVQPAMPSSTAHLAHTQSHASAESSPGLDSGARIGSKSNKQPAEACTDKTHATLFGSGYVRGKPSQSSRKKVPNRVNVNVDRQYMHRYAYIITDS